MEDESVADLSEFRMLDPVSKKAMYIGNALTLLALSVVLAAPVVMIRGTGWFNLTLASAAALLALAAAYLFVSPSIFYKHYRYRMDEDCIEVRRGVIVHSHTMVPVERVHQVNVRKGPVLRRFGLADVTITTAGGTVTLQYLEEDIAESVASSLNDKIVAMLRARE
ncbi:MAG: PH domain-containing protein [Candidatus Methanomethylophilaceae archaeon]|nr:PH domain-containing protein [Candidatus Methanomethylophilaceae archaeon]